MRVSGDIDVWDLARTLPSQLKDARRRPGARDVWDAESAFGEVRALAHEGFTGGELWSEWVPVFRAFKARRNVEVGAYVREVWETPTPLTSLQDLRRAFIYSANRAWIEAFRGRGVSLFLEPASPEQLSDWEREHALSLPPYFRDFLGTIGAGAELTPEHRLFALGEAEFAVPLRPVASWTYPTAQNNLKLLTNAIDHLMRHPSERSVREEDLKELPPTALAQTMAETAVVLESYFEGNHGDHEMYLLSCGPRAGETLVASDVHHMDGTYTWGETLSIGSAPGPRSCSSMWSECSMWIHVNTREV